MEKEICTCCLQRHGFDYEVVKKKERQRKLGMEKLMTRKEAANCWGAVLLRWMKAETVV